MAQTIIDVLSKIMLMDTELTDAEPKLADIVLELPTYYNKIGIFSNPVVWANVNTTAPMVFGDTWGGSDMPKSAPYLVRLQAAKPNQTSAERAIKGYKFINDKTRTNAGKPSV